MIGSLVALLLAAPDAGTTWTWSFDDAIVVKLDKGAVEAIPTPSLRKAQLLVTVTEAGEMAPKRFSVQVLDGNDSLKGRTWNVENNYGEPMLSEVGARKKGPPANVKEALAQQQGTSQEDVRVFARVVGTLLTPDPIVEAAQSGAACDETVRNQIGTGAAKFIKKLVARGEERAVRPQTSRRGPAHRHELPRHGLGASRRVASDALAAGEREDRAEQRSHRLAGAERAVAHELDEAEVSTPSSRSRFCSFAGPTMCAMPAAVFGLSKRCSHVRSVPVAVALRVIVSR